LIKIIRITDSISLSEKEIQFEAIRASGPGGQHVNKTSTAILLKFDIHASSLPKDVAERLFIIAKTYISTKGELQIKAQNYRSQKMNKTDAISRLISLIQTSAEKPKIRRATRIPKRENEKRLRSKKQQSQKKALRKMPKQNED
jgi:ribosome-associated protein